MRSRRCPPPSRRRCTSSDGRALLKYIQGIPPPTASMRFRQTILEMRHAPSVASYSSRGPSQSCPNVLKPSNFPSRQLQLIYPGGLNSTDGEAEFCQDGSLDKYNVKGKVVMCAGNLGAGTSKGAVVKKAGGAAMIFMNTASGGSTNIADHILSAASLTYADDQRLRAYAKSTLSENASATATILFRGTKFGAPPSPTVASFSSRGPSASCGSSILKPDVLGPGINILGAYPWKVGPVRNPSASRQTNKGFAVLSDTSMSTPHIVGVAALLKVSHLSWSPEAIRSALMTTVDPPNRIGDPITVGETDKAADFYATGAGHVNPSRAAEPGLVYDIRPRDYLGFLCADLGYTDDQLRAVARRRVNCSSIRTLGAEELNYPSITVTLGASSPLKNVTRTVTNVGEASVVLVACSDKDGRLNLALTGRGGKRGDTWVL